MRRFLLLVPLIGLADAPSVFAQDLDWLFKGAQPHARAVRSRRRLQASTEVPLPVPRPRFLGDAAKPGQDMPSPKPAEAAIVGSPAPPPKPLPAPDTPPPPSPALAGAVVPNEPTTISDTKPTSPTMIPLPPEKPQDLPTSREPTVAQPVAPSGATTAFDPRQPAADPGCVARLKEHGVDAVVSDPGPQPDPRCTVEQPMRLVSTTLADGSVVNFPDKPTIACTTADAFSAYVHDLLAPLAKGTWGVGLASVWTGPGLECRSRDHIFGAKLSAHGQGLAIDIAQLKLSDGHLVSVGEPKSDAERSFETAARAGGCGYFHTALGPGSDSYHRTHWHFDLEVRGRDGDSKYCK